MWWRSNKFPFRDYISLCLCVILKTFGWKNVQVISNQLFIQGLLMIRFYHFNLRVTLWNLEITSLNNIKTKFTSGTEENGLLSLLDIKLSHENNKFAIPVYSKPTFFTNFESFTPDTYKRRLIETLIHRSFR